MPPLSSHLNQKLTPIAIIGRRSLKRRPLSKLKSLWEDNRDMWRRYPVETAILNATFLTAVGLGGWLGVLSIDDLALPEHPGFLQIEEHSFVPAHSTLLSPTVILHKEDAWYVTGRIQGQDPTQTVDVEVSKQEFQSDKVGDAIPVSFSTSRLTHTLKARRATDSTLSLPHPKLTP